MPASDMPAPDQPASGTAWSGLRLAVLIPCFNEEVAIAGVVEGFARALPGAAIYVYDNNSSDRTAETARAHGAVVRHERLQGKGNVIRRAFADVEADIYVLVDGDGTYDPAAAAAMVRLLVAERLDMVTGTRVTDANATYRPGHRIGNIALTAIVRHIFGNRISDMLSGYRVFSRRFVKSFPALAAGFETETEFTVYALEMKMPVGELPTRYIDRAPGSESKLRTWSDGLRILTTIVLLVKEERPLQFFGLAGLLLLLVSVLLVMPVVSNYLQTGLVPRLPTALLATALGLLAFGSLLCGLILDSVARGRKEHKRTAYLAIPALSGDEPEPAA